jgi:opacity protein-like surface antigen
MKEYERGVSMKKYVWKPLAIGLALFWLGMVTLWAQAEPQKITVKAQAASIYAKPDAGSQVIEKPSVGSVYEVVRKVGEWYEIKLPSRLGMVITGFIHEKSLETENLVVVPGQEPSLPRKPKMGYISLGGLLHFVQVGYDYTYPWNIYDEEGAIYDSAYNQNAFGFELGLGFFILKNIEIDVGFHYVSKALEGLYALDFPNKQKYFDIAYAEASANPKINEMMFNLGANFHLLKEGRLRPYLGGGISYINGKIDLLDDIEFNETFYVDKTHTIEITGVIFTSKTVNALGFYGKAGIDFEVSSALSIFGEGQYLMAKKDVPHPLATKLSDGQEQLLEINLGGASALFGIKIRF